jgi:hypothetical protein
MRARPTLVQRRDTRHADLFDNRVVVRACSVHNIRVAAVLECCRCASSAIYDTLCGRKEGRNGRRACGTSAVGERKDAIERHIVHRAQRLSRRHTVSDDGRSNRCFQSAHAAELFGDGEAKGRQCTAGQSARSWCLGDGEAWRQRRRPGDRDGGGHHGLVAQGGRDS